MLESGININVGIPDCVWDGERIYFGVRAGRRRLRRSICGDLPWFDNIEHL